MKLLHLKKLYNQHIYTHIYGCENVLFSHFPFLYILTSNYPLVLINVLYFCSYNVWIKKILTYFSDQKLIIFYYNSRPYDCRLYPYDIKKINGRFFLVLYKLDCIQYKNFSENVDYLIEKIKPFIDTFTDIRYNNKLNELEYIIIKEIDI